MKSDEINILIHRVEDLLSYYDKYSEYIVIDDERIACKDQEIPARRVVTGADYISAYVDILNALSVLETNNDKDVVDYCNLLKKNISIIIDDKVSVNYIIGYLNDMKDIYEENIRSIGDDDLLYFEFASDNRETIENLIQALTGYFKINKDHAFLTAYIRNLEVIDTSFKDILMKIYNNYPKLEKPFPKHPFYTPAYYWWYLKKQGQ